VNPAASCWQNVNAKPSEDVATTEPQPLVLRSTRISSHGVTVSLPGPHS
jgi:hypothetical protein